MAVTVIRDVTTRYLDTRVRVTMVIRNLRLILIVAWRPMVCLCFQYFYRRPTKLREGNVFSRVCVSVYSFKGGGDSVHGARTVGTWLASYWNASLL